MSIKRVLVITFAGLVFLSGVTTAYMLGKAAKKDQTATEGEQAETTQAPLGGDRDKHGCIPSAGYSWCEAKKKCLREWEEECEEVLMPTGDETESIKATIKTQLIAEHGPDAENLTISVSKIDGAYAQGGASEPGVGGGMWFAVKTEAGWQLLWDGNGVVTCESIADYPEFPASLIPECYDGVTQNMVTR